MPLFIRKNASRLMAFLAIGGTFLAGNTAFAEARFEDFPAKIYTGKNARLKLDSPEVRAFRTRLKAAANDKPNFAGHYVLVTWGCGAQCEHGAAIDVTNGAVTFLPATVCCWEDKEPLSYRPDSNLIVVGGVLDESTEDGYHPFVMENGTFRKLGP